MSKPWIHAQSSAKQLGGIPEDYMAIHEFMDSSKSVTSLATHRALTHNSWFISMVLPRVFGETFIRKSDGKVVSTRDIGEQHVAEDFKGFVPSASDFLDVMELQPWMMNRGGHPPSHQRTSKVRKKKPEIVTDRVDLDIPFPSLDKTLPFDGRPWDVPRIPLQPYPQHNDNLTID